MPANDRWLFTAPGLARPDLPAVVRAKAGVLTTILERKYAWLCPPEYVDPVEFFRRTYLTDGLRRLLRDALARVAGFQ